MQKILITLLLLMCSMSLMPAHALPRFRELKEHGKLFFTFTTIPTDQQPTHGVGKWQIFILTPDKRKYKSPLINAQDPPSKIRILVKPPILYGTYTVVVTNHNVVQPDGSPFIGGFINSNVTVTNSFNIKCTLFDIESASPQTGAPNLPKQKIQGFFVPAPNFISH